MLYGTTPYGGSEQCSGEPCGTVFSLTPPSTPGGAWTYTTIYSFTGGSDGAAASGPLAIGSGGVLYGTTNSGGIDCGVCGAVFSLTPPASPGGAWTEAVIYTFRSWNDSFRTVVMGRGGVLYGTSSLGGSGTNSACQVDQCGTIFSLSPPASPGGAWTEAVLHNFAGPPSPSDRDNPQSSLVLGKDGVLFGTTNGGGASNAGIVFAFRP